MNTKCFTADCADDTDGDGNQESRNVFQYFSMSAFCFSFQGVIPFQSRKAGEVSVRGLQDQTAFNRQRRQVGVGGQIARRAKVPDQTRQQREMSSSLRAKAPAERRKLPGTF